jgi:CBS-domain-containing membrane protein
MKKILFYPPLVAGIGATICIAFLAYLNISSTQNLWLIPPFGASIVLITAAHSSPLAQPRNIFFGHIISSICGLVVIYFFDITYVSIGFSVGLAVSLMMVTKTVHPPAGANPIIIMMGNEGFSFLLMPVSAGAAILVLYAVIFNKYIYKREYPFIKSK